MNRQRFIIRTSDRRTFRRCPRKWEMITPFRKNLKRDGTETNINFWFGSAIHWALEDYHGANLYGDPRRAFYAYYQAFDEKPALADAMYDLGINMLTYYMQWLPAHNKVHNFQTAWIQPETRTLSTTKVDESYIPAVEQSFMLDLGVKVAVNIATDEIVQVFWHDLPFEYVEDSIINFDTVYGDTIEVVIVGVFYHGTMDKIVYDNQGRYWICDYKTAKGADTEKLVMDDQVSAYLWAFSYWYGIQPQGFIYHQLTKEAPQHLRELKNGDFSTDKRQKTTYAVARQDLLDRYKVIEKVPKQYIDLLNALAEKESEEGDKFIRWDLITRSPEELASVQENLFKELKLMLDPEYETYPVPNKDCSWECPFREWCIAYERKDEAAMEFFMKDWVVRPVDEEGNQDPWKNDLPTPEEIADVDIMANVNVEFNIVLPEEVDGFQFMYED